MRHGFTQLDLARKIFKRLILPFFVLIMATGLIATPANATGVYDLPYISAGEPTWVIDSAEVISISNERRLSNALEKLAGQTGNEVRMIAIRRLDYGATIDSLADDIFAKWFPTPEAGANQTILLMDTLTNNIAIRTGENIKSIMSDEIAESVAGETAAVPLRTGSKYNQAFLDASDRLIAVLSGQEDPGPPVVTDNINVEGTFTTAEETDAVSSTIWIVVLLVLATVIPMVTYFWYVGFGN